MYGQINYCNSYYFHLGKINPMLLLLVFDWLLNEFE